MDLVVGEVRLLLHPLSREGALIETGEMKCLERRERESEKEIVLSSEKKALEKFAREKDSTFLCTRSLFQEAPPRKAESETALRLQWGRGVFNGAAVIRSDL